MTKPGPKVVTKADAKEAREAETRKTLAWIAKQGKGSKQ